MKPGPKLIFYYLLGLLVLWFPLVPLPALDAPAWVNDGAGSDIEYTNNDSEYSANWEQIDWSSAPEPLEDGHILVYEVDLEKNTNSGWQEVSDGLDEELSSDPPVLPDTKATVSEALIEGTEYRVKVVAFWDENLSVGA